MSSLIEDALEYAHIPEYERQMVHLYIRREMEKIAKVEMAWLEIDRVMTEQQGADWREQKMVIVAREIQE